MDKEIEAHKKNICREIEVDKEETYAGTACVSQQINRSCLESLLPSSKILGSIYIYVRNS